MKLTLLTLGALFAAVAHADDPLPSWNEGAAKKSIVDFVERVTKPGSPDFVPDAERIATFDNDGTLWAEQPMYFQAFFIFDRVKALAPQHPEWKSEEPFASVLKGDVKAALAGGEHAIFEMAMATHAGMTTEEFEKIVRDWVATAKHPKTGRLLTEMVYQPMLEVLAYLRANGFKTFIASGGGIEFMRPWSERVYGIPPEQVIGSSGKTTFELRDGKPVLMKLPEVSFVDDKGGKPVAIQHHIGRRPIASFGNSDGDLQMLQWTAGGAGPRFCLYVHHTDAEREWAYDRESSIGRLDKGLDEARQRGWTVVSIKQDWKRVFPFDSERKASAAPSTDASTTSSAAHPDWPPQPWPAGMVWIPGGEFTMGTDDPEAWPAERPTHRVRVTGFWMDETEVTNAQFRAFADATGHVTTAQIKPDWEELKKQVPPGTEKPADDMLVAASIVFTPPPSGAQPDDLENIHQWWTWTPGANRRHPQGPKSSIEGREDHPVIHVSWDDAVAYAKWARKGLPTEAQWEFAARGGLDRKEFVWGDEHYSEIAPQCNAWQGVFPSKNTVKDGFERSAPVRSFSPNGFGLYDMAGNVWEWCADWYRMDTYARLRLASGGSVVVDPVGPESAFDPNNPHTPERVIRGGSFLCHPSYCSSYRPSARRGNSPDTSTEHQGFRCVMSDAAWRARIAGPEVPAR